METHCGANEPEFIFVGDRHHRDMLQADLRELR
jgi:hypothetical protein